MLFTGSFPVESFAVVLLLQASPHLSEPGNAGNAAPPHPLSLFLSWESKVTPTPSHCAATALTESPMVQRSAVVPTSSQPMPPCSLFPGSGFPPSGRGWPGGTYLPHHRLLLIRDRALPLISFSCAPPFAQAVSLDRPCGSTLCLAGRAFSNKINTIS